MGEGGWLVEVRFGRWTYYTKVLESWKLPQSTPFIVCMCLEVSGCGGWVGGALGLKIKQYVVYLEPPSAMK